MGSEAGDREPWHGGEAPAGEGADAAVRAGGGMVPEANDDDRRDAVVTGEAATRSRHSPKDRDSWGRRLRTNGLTVARRATFLSVLSETSNVHAAARAAGAHESSFYLLRDRDTDFAAAWARALGHGHEALATGLLARARGTGPADDTIDEPLAMMMLKRLDVAAAGRVERRPVGVRHLSLRMVHDELLRRIALVTLRLERGGR